MKKYEKEVLQAQIDNEKAVLKKIEENYEDALAEINDKIAILLGRQDADQQYVIYQVEFQKSLKKQVEAILETLHSNEFETVSEYLAKSYEEGFVGAMYSLQNQGIPLIFPIDQEQVVQAIQADTKLSESLYASMGHDITDLKKKITGEISRGLSSGQMYSEITRNIASWARIPKNNAMRIARTEAHRIQTKASFDAQHKAKSKGADVVKQWDATLDGKTRDSHRKLDGEVRELDEPFSNGLMYPGDPSGSAAEVINCRCALLQRARWALGNDYTKWSPDAPVVVDDDGTTQFVMIDAKNYEGFKKIYTTESKVVETKKELKDVVTEKKAAKAKDMDKMSLPELQALAEKTAVEYYKSGASGISFGGANVEDVAKRLAKQGSKTSLKKDILSMQKKLGKGNQTTERVRPSVQKINPLEKNGKSSTIESDIVAKAIESGKVSTTINIDKQNRHIKGNKDYIEGRSYIKGTAEDAQKLVNELSGTGEPVYKPNGEWNNREKVIADKVIGVNVDPNTLKETDTTKATIHYSKTGSHIIPRREK